MKRRVLTLAATLLVGSAGCLQYESTSDDPAGVDTSAGDTTAPDAGADAAEDVPEGSEDVAEDVPDGSEEVVDPNDWGRDIPTYSVVACEERADLVETFRPPACDYDVLIQPGLLNAKEICGTAVDPPEGLHLTFPTADAGRTIAMSWTTPETTRESVVRIGDSPDNLDRVYWGHTLTYPGLLPRWTHEVHVCGLLPGRTYYYQAGGEGAWSDVHSFATAPDPTQEDYEVVFGVTGDTRSDTFEMWGQCVEQMRALGAEFIVFSGDAVDAGPVQAQWDRFFAQGQPEMAELPYIPANGNHDLIVANYTGQFALPNNEINFTVNYGRLGFVSMTDTYPQDFTAVAGSFKEYLDQALATQAEAHWKFLVNHRPFYSASTNHGSAEDLQDNWGPVVDRHGVDIVFNGHDHNYERSRPIKDGAVDPTGTIYSVIAGVGAPLYDNGSQWWTELSERVPAFAILRVTPTEVQFTAYRLDGTTIDSTTLTR